MKIKEEIVAQLEQRMLPMNCMSCFVAALAMQLTCCQLGGKLKTRAAAAAVCQVPFGSSCRCLRLVHMSINFLHATAATTTAATVAVAVAVVAAGNSNENA